ncbi:hypothetical protein ACTQ49_02565 [Luteococcus sp. Sow4_B9]|uniref:hypothetical protein n=1 Tax=Luteococcus sp. Sow4_B9 TaxID=3438792 RepID=UPI003F983C54
MMMIISLPPAHAGFHVSTTRGQGPFYQRLGATVAPDEVLGRRREMERAIGLDQLGERVVVSFDLAHVGNAIRAANTLRG